MQRFHSFYSLSLLILGPEEELQVVVLDESHIEINISPRKRTPDTGEQSVYYRIREKSL